MYKSCKTKQSADRQRYIIMCLRDLLQTQSFAEITVQQICRRADIPGKTFYRYFSGKQDVLDAMIDFAIVDFESFPGPYQKGDARTSEKDLEKLFLFWYQNRDLLVALRRSGMSARLIERTIAVNNTGKVGARFATVSGSTESDEFRMMTCFSISGLYALILDWQYSGFQKSPQQMARAAIRLLTQPLYQSIPDVCI